MRVLSILISIIIFSYSTSISQKTYTVAKVGDILPNLQLSNILNYKTANAQISDFKAGLVILDFWATWCAPCISAFPKLDSLQKHFAGKVQIVPVTREDKLLVKNVLTRMKGITNLLPMTVTGDIELNKIFPHTYLPHYVWINQERKVIAITDGSAVNEKNINLYFRNNGFNLPVKKDQQIRVMEANGFNLFAPSILVKDSTDFQVSRLPKQSIGFSSLLTKYVEGLHPGFTKIDSTHFYAVNNSIKFLYRLALYGTSPKVLNTTNVIVEIKDSTLLGIINSRPGITSAEFFDWLKHNGYCYELKLPPNLAKKKFDFMLKDLNNYFGTLYDIEGRLEERVSKYLALEKIKKTELLKADGKEKIAEDDNFHLKIKNYPISVLLNQLTLPLQSYPMLLDETGITENINIELNCVLSDLKAVNKELDRYGLRLTEKEKMLQIAIIKQLN